ncbi:MAG: imelysin family protein [Acuticoccus sp.]
MKTIVAAILLAGWSLTPAVAAGDPPAFKATTAALIADVVVPAHAAFTAAAQTEAGAVDALCATPGTGTLAAARTGFAALVAAFGQVELYRFGPAREDNRVERLFFWPDRRGRALRQVQGVLANEDETATSPETLTIKSVALQGLPALEFALFGTGSETLAETAGFRCRYAASIAQVIAAVAAAIEAEWRGPFAGLMTTAGPDNPAYRSDGEAFQDFLQAAAEQLELIGDHKIRAVIGERPEAAKPRLAPFWRADATVAAIIANLDGVEALLTEDVAALLGDEAAMVGSARNELDRAKEMLRPLAADPRGFEAVAGDPHSHRRMVAARYAIDGARGIFAERMPAALGLISGFNSMDGD